MVYICEGCRQELGPEDRVVAAAEQVDVSNQERREYIDGQRGLWHERHWHGNTARHQERTRGTLAELT
jgi:adenosylmethionine-8-amino-7-oxononanoate aminotransferase